MESNTVLRGREVVIWREDAYGIEYGYKGSKGCNLEGRHVWNRIWFYEVERL